MSVLVGYLMHHGLVNGPGEMDMIQSPFLEGSRKLQNLLTLTEQNGGRDGYFLLYKCFCESREENPLGHGDVVDVLERYGKRLAQCMGYIILKPTIVDKTAEFMLFPTCPLY